VANTRVIVNSTGAYAQASGVTSNATTTYSTTTSGHTAVQVWSGAGAGDKIYFAHGSNNFVASGFSSFTMPATAQVRGLFVQTACEYLNTGAGAGDSTPSVSVYLQDAGTGYYWYQEDVTGQVGPLGSGTVVTSTSQSALWNGTAAVPITQSIINNLKVWFVNNAVTNTPELRQTTFQLVVDYNQQPTVVPAITGLSGGIVNSLSPTITWTYADPENDPQERFQVLVYEHEGALVGQLAFASGEIFSSANTYSIPTGVLKNYKSYRAVVFVSDSGSNGRYSNTDINSGAGGSNQGLDFVPQVEPMLMPTISFPGAAKNDNLLVNTEGLAGSESGSNKTGFQAGWYGYVTSSVTVLTDTNAPFRH
jgi:hypothetical protein